MSKRRVITVEYFLEGSRKRPRACSDLRFGETSALPGSDPLPTILNDGAVRYELEKVVAQLDDDQFGLWACDVLLVRSHDGGDIELHWDEDLDTDGEPISAESVADPDEPWKYEPYVQPPHVLVTRWQLRNILTDWAIFRNEQEPFTKTYDPGH